MKISQLIGKRIKDHPHEASTISHQYLLRGGYVRPLASGIYGILPLGMRILSKLEVIIREEMDGIGGQEVLMPLVMSRELWEESGRYQSIDESMLRIKDRNQKDLVLGMTHEEAVLALARTEVSSYRQFPFMLYQIQSKFRDELRPRGGLIRLREFTMKDAYSFHRSAEGLQEFYEKCYQAYVRIFERVGLKRMRIVQSDTGMMGGSIAHEFTLESSIGEDTLVLCDHCGYATNREALGSASISDGDACTQCGKTLRLARGIELGNIFQLGNRYTKAMGMSYLDENGKSQIPVMGCYGIGIERLMAAIIEDSHDARGPIWPWAVAPFPIHLCMLDAKERDVLQLSEAIYELMMNAGFDILWDDLNAHAGKQFADADLVAAPIRFVVSTRNGKRGLIEYSLRQSSEQGIIPMSDLLTFVRTTRDRLLRNP